MRKPSLLSRIVRRALYLLYRWRGWTLEGKRPDCDKFIVVGAPHTSNWDFVFFLGAARELGIKPSFIGKHTLFEGLQRRFMLDMGGVPVVRDGSGGYVRSVVGAFDAADELALVVAPEGSRTSTGEWRSGFYHIALGAGVPIVPAWVDHGRMRGGMGDPIMPSGDYRADLAKIAAFYRENRPDCARFEVLEKTTRTLDKWRADKPES